MSLNQNALLKVTDYDMKLTTFAIQFSIEADGISPEVAAIANELLTLTIKFGKVSQKHREEGFTIQAAAV